MIRPVRAVIAAARKALAARLTPAERRDLVQIFLHVLQLLAQDSEPARAEARALLRSLVDLLDKD